MAGIENEKFLQLAAVISIKLVVDNGEVWDSGDCGQEDDEDKQNISHFQCHQCHPTVTTSPPASVASSFSILKTSPQQCFSAILMRDKIWSDIVNFPDNPAMSAE